jgi:uncharacterized MAPEG superfamily protein
VRDILAACNRAISKVRETCENFANAAVTAKLNGNNDIIVRWLARELCRTINFTKVCVLGSNMCALNRENRNTIEMYKPI